MEKWGWNTQSQQQQQQQPHSTAAKPGSLLGSSLLNSALPAAPTRPRMPAGIVNPMMATADFSYENHPYQSHYVAPHNSLNNYQYESY
jgi:hypothetical protein